MALEKKYTPFFEIAGQVNYKAPAIIHFLRSKLIICEKVEDGVSTYGEALNEGAQVDAEMEAIIAERHT